MDSQIDHLDENLKAIANEIRGTKDETKAGSSTETSTETTTEQEGE